MNTMIVTKFQVSWKRSRFSYFKENKSDHTFYVLFLFFLAWIFIYFSYIAFKSTILSKWFDQIVQPCSCLRSFSFELVFFHHYWLPFIHLLTVSLPFLSSVPSLRRRREFRARWVSVCLSQIFPLRHPEVKDGHVYNLFL